MVVMEDEKEPETPDQPSKGLLAAAKELTAACKSLFMAEQNAALQEEEEEEQDTQRALLDQSPEKVKWNSIMSKLKGIKAKGKLVR